MLSFLPFFTQGARAQVESESVYVDSTMHADAIHLLVGHSIVLSTGSALRRVYIGDPKILQSFSSGQKEEVVTGKSCGVSTLILWDTSARRRVYNVFVDLDAEGMQKVLEDAVPGARLTVSTRAGTLFVAGTVPSDVSAEAVMKLATAYTKDVVDGVKVVPEHRKQVQLKLRIVEVDRTRLEQFGVNFFALGGSTLGGTTTQQFASTVLQSTSGGSSAITVSDPLNMLLYSAKLNAGVTVKDLEQKQVLQVLAEPTLTTLSGEPAKFLSGGEFPLPIVQGGTSNSTAITIVFKPYGVKVEFTPTANADGSIRLKVAPEVSALDYTNAVTISGFTIPALSTRRAETELELANGQSFVMSGLLDHRTSDILSKMPGIANVPILGQLFRSKNITHSVVELVVLVTATVIDPLAPGFAPPSPAALPKTVVPHLESAPFDRNFGTQAGRGVTPVPPALPGKGQP